MSSVLERAKAHFGMQRSISLPEWKDEAGQATVLYWRPFTLDEQRKLRSMREAAGDDDTDGMLRLIIAKAQDAAGQKVFTIEDRPALRSAVDAVVIDRIISAMLSTDSVEQAEKN